MDYFLACAFVESFTDFRFYIPGLIDYGAWGVNSFCEFILSILCSSRVSFIRVGWNGFSITRSMDLSVFFFLFLFLSFL